MRQMLSALDNLQPLYGLVAYRGVDPVEIPQAPAAEPHPGLFRPVQVREMPESFESED